MLFQGVDFRVDYRFWQPELGYAVDENPTEFMQGFEDRDLETAG